MDSYWVSLAYITFPFSHVAKEISGVHRPYQARYQMRVAPYQHYQAPPIFLNVQTPDSRLQTSEKQHKQVLYVVVVRLFSHFNYTNSNFALSTRAAYSEA